MKIIFSKDGVAVIKEVDFGPFGPIDSHIEYTYDEHLPISPETPLSTIGVTATIENNILKEIILEIAETKEPQNPNSIKQSPSAPYKQPSTAKYVGHAVASKTQEHYDIYQTTDRYLA